jgi:hypothetical protein
MNTDPATNLPTKIRAALNECDDILQQQEADPYEAGVVEAEGAITAAQALLAEADSEPDRLAPEEIVAMRNRARDAQAVAEINLRRAQGQRRQLAALLFTKAREIRSDARAMIEEARRIFEAGIEAALLELSQGYWSEYTKGVSEPKAIAKHRGYALRRAENSLSDRHAQPDTLPAQISIIRKALQVALDHLEPKP